MTVRDTTACSGVPGARARRLLPALAAAVLLACAACGGGGPAATVTATVDPDTGVDKGAAPDPDLPLVWPLTGVRADEVAQRPALAVKIENAPQARPQTGLEQADVVWEEVVEGGITRFLAVYHSQEPALVGPVRSVRPTDPQLVAPLHGVLAYTGGQAPFITEVGAAGVQSVIMDAGDGGFEKTPRRRAPHNVYGRLADFWAQADDDRTSPPPAPLVFAREPGRGTATTTGADAPALVAALTFASTARWDWSGEEGAYLRSEGDTPAVSADGVRLGAENVVLVRVPMVNTSFKDPAGVPVPETRVVGSGDGVLASGGKQVAVTWAKDDVDAPLVLTGPDDEPVALEPGRTWIELVPEDSGSWDVG
ncbi:DUF3048 domain-containing protein [Cellulosimicrobium arenosum]|uniref:DUF3048 domain-containing protein n=1 Tax=Cellulosimicrobium arenosum TaxID=2708133 RepID=A0A927J098_9MICO|nr:DUF3048 domain-containing protein [Cellulosimicrobium arenosum]MBD8079491.1 DUF3048 domain-containing protein [Cellulosimicrobium arenosum]